MVQLVERLLAKEKVVGSSPIARSKNCGLKRLIAECFPFSNLLSKLDLQFFGDVAKWQGKGLQNPDHGFKSRRRLLS